MALDLVALARNIATQKGYDPDTFVRQIRQESNFNPNAHNKKSGADGIAQIIPRWHPSMAGRTRDPIASLEYAASWNASLLKNYGGSYAKQLAAYNWGPGNVAQWDGRKATLPGETIKYLDATIGPDWKPNTGDEGQSSGPGDGGSVQPSPGGGSRGQFWDVFWKIAGAFVPGLANAPDPRDVAWSVGFWWASSTLITIGLLGIALGNKTVREGASQAAMVVPQLRAAGAVTQAARATTYTNVARNAPQTVTGAFRVVPSTARRVGKELVSNSASGALAAGVIDA